MLFVVKTIQKLWRYETFFLFRRTHPLEHEKTSNIKKCRITQLGQNRIKNFQFRLITRYTNWTHYTSCYNLPTKNVNMFMTFRNRNMEALGYLERIVLIDDESYRMHTHDEHKTHIIRGPFIL